MPRFLLYQDDVPDGICGQSGEIMSNWTMLIDVTDFQPEDVRKLWRMDAGELSQYLGVCGINGARGRKNARIVDQFSDLLDDRDWDYRKIIHLK